MRLDILEEIDRKQEWLYGRSFMKLNILDGWFHMEILDPQDVLVDRYAKPHNIHTGRRVAYVNQVLITSLVIQPRTHNIKRSPK